MDVTPSRPERWRAIAPRLLTLVSKQPDMTTQTGPRRWAVLLLEWGCEAMRLAYPKDTYREAIYEAVDDFLSTNG